MKLARQTAFIASIVEGHGEVEALPKLLHSIAASHEYIGQLLVNPPIRVKSGSFFNDLEYRRKQLILASSKAAQRDGMVLVLLDCEDDCPATVGPPLLAEARKIRADVPFFVALAYREYETWFISAARSLRGCRGLPADLEPPADPESIRAAKEWLGRRMDVDYDPITHQPEFTRIMSLAEARSNNSFERLYGIIGDYLS